MSEWISVKEALPASERTVLITAVHKHPHTGKDIYNVFYAFYENGDVLMENSDYEWDFDPDLDDVLRYNQKADDYYVPSGWYECVEFSERFSPIWSEYKVIAWMNLPEPFRPTKEDITPPEMGTIKN